MKIPRRFWTQALKLMLCALLLLWVFHGIFLQEGRVAIEQKDVDWDDLKRSEQIIAAWSEGPKAIWKTLSVVHPLAYAVSLFFMGLTLLLGTMRWRMALAAQGLNLPFSRAVEISLIAHFFNSFLLGSTGGDLLKAYYAARETHHKKTEAVTTVFVDRLIGLFSMLLFAAFLMILNRSLIVNQDMIAALSVTIVGMLVACGFLVYLAFWGRNSGKESLLSKWLQKLPKGDYLERSLRSCRVIGKQRGFLIKALALSMALNLALVLQFAAVAYGLGLSVSFTTLMFIVPAIICISALPLTPSGLGVREHLFVQTLTVTAIGVDAKLALSLSLLAYSGSLAWSVLGGIVYVNLKDSRDLDEVTKE
ncbi:MAG: lysylphosphatidylglycerol synthase transmembrane domain-containing protein [Verrucomicrobiia bacterium]|jgi:uncharacterized protein (TIRG00374 family)